MSGVFEWRIVVINFNSWVIAKPEAIHMSEKSAYRRSAQW